jgi:hypothetical protein
MLKVFGEIEQGSEEWRKIRCGLPTASAFKCILAKGEGKTRRAYLNRLAAEIVTGEPLESFSSPAMDRGRQMEAQAREFYAFLSDADPEQVGFIRNGNKGASPDSLIGSDGLLEIKTQRGDLLIETLLKDELPHEHVAQIQGQIWVSERSWCDLLVFWPGMPPFVRRAYRDEQYIRSLADAVDKFNEELIGVVEKIKRLGGGGLANAA